MIDVRIEAFPLSSDYRAEIDSTRVLLYASKDKL